MLHEAVDKVKEGLLLHLNHEMKKAISMIEGTMDKIQLEVKTFAVDHARIDEIKDSLKGAFTGYDLKFQDGPGALNIDSKEEVIDRLTYNEQVQPHRRMRSLKQNPSKPVLDFEMGTFEENSQPRSLRSTSRPNLNESPKNKELTDQAEVKSEWGLAKVARPDEYLPSSKSNYEAKFHQFFSKHPVDKQPFALKERHGDSAEQAGSQLQVQSVSKDQDSFTTPLPEPPSNDVNEFFNTEMDKIIKHYLSDTSSYFPKQKAATESSPIDRSKLQAKHKGVRSDKSKHSLAMSVPAFYPAASKEDTEPQQDSDYGGGTALTQSTPAPKQELLRDQAHFQSLISVGNASRQTFGPKQHSPIPNKTYYAGGISKHGGYVNGLNAFVNPHSKFASSTHRLPSDPTKKVRSRSNAQLQQSVGKKNQPQMPIHLSGMAAASSYKQRFEDLYRKSREQRSPPVPTATGSKTPTMPTAKFSSDPNVAMEEPLLGKSIRKVSESHSDLPIAKVSAMSRTSGATPGSVAQLVSKMGVSHSKKDKYSPSVFTPLFPN